MVKRDHREQHTQLAAILKQSRKKAGLTQADVAKRLGRPQSFVAKYEGNERKIDVVDLMAICDALNISWKTILTAFEKRLADN